MPGIYRIEMHLQRVSGDVASWRGSNQLFECVTQALPVWRTIPQEVREEYLAGAQLASGSAPEAIAAQLGRRFSQSRAVAATGEEKEGDTGPVGACGSLAKSGIRPRITMAHLRPVAYGPEGEGPFNFPSNSH